ncbi:hypothetical protein WN944_011089 [Citrus x changshan-huyou]|uniref:Uncharacterized protein n=1 Tax=Citrus x changshan-huyou TaxID=2935761 RepID=A0AAP0MST3_9ROSI
MQILRCTISCSKSITAELLPLRTITTAHLVTWVQASLHVRHVDPRLSSLWDQCSDCQTILCLIVDTTKIFDPTVLVIGVITSVPLVLIKF